MVTVSVKQGDWKTGDSGIVKQSKLDSAWIDFLNFVEWNLDPLFAADNLWVILNVLEFEDLLLNINL